MEVIHRHPKQLKWDSSKPKVRRLPPVKKALLAIKRKEKEKIKEKVKGNLKVHLSLTKVREKCGKGKGKNKSKGKNGKSGAKSTPAVPIAATPALGSTTSVEGPKKRPKQCVHYASPTGCLCGKDC